MEGGEHGIIDGQGSLEDSPGESGRLPWGEFFS